MYNCRVENDGGFDTEARTVTGKGCDVKKCSLTACNFYLDTVYTGIYLVIPIALKRQALKNNLRVCTRHGNIANHTYAYTCNTHPCPKYLEEYEMSYLVYVTNRADKMRNFDVQ